MVGHSVGGLVALMATNRYGPELAGAIVVDTIIRGSLPADLTAGDKWTFVPPRRYPTKEDAVARFRLSPEQNESLPFVLAHIAKHSVCEVEGGWAWKFDQEVFNSSTLDPDI